jgi:hypothetical protein
METILTGFGYPNRPPQHTIGNNMPPLVLQHAAMPHIINLGELISKCFCVCLLHFYDFLKLILNRLKFGKIFNMKKLRQINIFPTTYHLQYAVRRFETKTQKTVPNIKKFGKQNQVFSNLLLNCK